MGVGEKHSARGKTIDIRGLRLGVTAQTANPIVEVIYGDQQNVGLFAVAYRYAVRQRGQRPTIENSTAIFTTSDRFLIIRLLFSVCLKHARLTDI